MVVPYIWILIIITYFLLWIAYEYQNYLFVNMAGLFLFILGVTIIAEGIGDTANFTTEAFGIINIAIGAYVLITKNLELVGGE